ncbi:interferon-stimulated 20 kDa exonuclease-like 2 isoform X1 [Poecilia latipinna]|uniref:interferon-stimulated 20 kDa exonuclease-like 2 isoform X1 n=2 Tax=Poecilia latipinna TaxID=48699 RepID=UPI00072EC880|nr:PREDICTED: interferon-stimulated 20 kDa exonuclease-like 2 isoform X1 [Poecilia latipinna]
MSNIMIHVSPSVDTPQGIIPTKNQESNRKKKKKQFLKKMKYLKGKGCFNDNSHQRRNHEHNQASKQNGPFTRAAPSHMTTKRQSSPQSNPSSSGVDRSVDLSSGPSTSSFNPLSITFTVTNKNSLTKPNQPVNTKTTATLSFASKPSAHKLSTPIGNPTKYLAIDCEMVGAGPKGSISQLARCSIVSYDGDVVYDKFIKPSMYVTDFRTRWSGIRPKDLFKATPFVQARKEILRLLMGKIVIGHAIHNDFKALGYTHPADLTRDTSKIPLLNLKAGFGEKECASLKRLTKAIFNRDIQTGKKGHSSVEDAKATMELYKVVEEEWERTLASTS